MKFKELVTTFLIITILRVCNCKFEIIEQIDKANLTDGKYSGFLYYKNQTLQLNSLLFDKSYNSYFIEMEINVTRTEQEDVLLLLALSQTFGLQYSNKTQYYEADFIDKRGYYMKKKYYRIDFEKSYLIYSNPLYLTIFQASQNILTFNYTLTFGIQDNGEEKRCPFDCFSENMQGTCNKETGHCACQKGFFDLDCSRQSFNLDFYQEQSLSSPYNFVWKTTFSKNVRSAFYHQISDKLSGYLYLQIKMRDNSSIQETDSTENLGFLKIFYTSESHNSPNLQVADTFYSKSSFGLSEKQLLNGEEIFLEQFKVEERQLKSEPSSDDENIDNSDEEQIKQISIKQSNALQLLFGFRQEWSEDRKEDFIEYDVILILKEHGPQDEIGSLFLQSKATVIIMSIILVLLIGILIILVIYLHKKTQMINIAISTLHKRKSKKELEFTAILELIPSFKYTEEVKQQMTLVQEEEPTCSVCLCEFEIDETVKKTYCPHYFHEDCLQEWIRKQKNCPHCRNVLTARTIKQKLESGSQVHQSVENVGFQVQKSPKKKNNYIQQIDDDITVDVSKKSKSGEGSKKSISPDKSNISSISPKKSKSPPKSPWNKNMADISEIITTVRPHKKAMKRQRTQSTMTAYKSSQTPKGLTLHKLPSLETPANESVIKPRSETFIPNIHDFQNISHAALTLGTEIITQTGDRTNTNLKNRGSILSIGMNSAYESQHSIKKKSQSHKKSNLSQLIKRADSLFENENDNNNDN